MANIKISEIAAELGYQNKETLEKINELGFDYKSPQKAVSEDVAAAIYEYLKNGTIQQILKDEVAKSSKSAKKSSTKSTTSKTTKSKTEKAEKSTKTEKIEKTKKTESKQKEILKEETKEDKQETKEEKIVEEKITKVEVKEEMKSKEIAKEELVQEEPVSLARSGLEKRRGLVIIKKKNAVKEEVKEEVKPKAQSKEPVSFASIFSTDESLKKKKAKKIVPAARKESSSKMDFDTNFAEINDDEDDVVVMPDFSFNERKEDIEKPAKAQTSLRSAFNNQINQFTNTSIARSRRKKSKAYKKEQSSEEITSIKIPKEIRLYELAEKLGKKDSELISKLFMQGMMTTKNDFLDEETIEILGLEFGIEISFFDETAQFDYVADYEENQEELKDIKVPVVTIMGHVDHGKTSLLDYIRNSRVASGEAGGITQHVGAYMVNKNGKNITFIDTPGHEAFSAMRARGASVTDIVIIVVAADDGVKPQTKEAISHAKAAGVPIIIAVNKIDKEAANPDRVKTQLAELDIMPTEWGGSHEFVHISALKGTGIEDLLEIILLQAEILELKANKNTAAKANIVESSLQKGRGVVTTVIMENGTLRVGDTVVAGIAYGRVKSITDSKGNALKEILPGECGVIMGLNEIPDAGETLISVATDKEARDYAQKRHEYLRQKELSKSTKVSLDELSAKIKEGNLKSLPVILKADVGGTLEAIRGSLEKLSNDEVKVDIVLGGVGGISQGDIALAQASGGVIVGFNVRPTGDIKEKAKEAKVEIKTYNVIYNLIDEIKAILGGLMSPIISEEQLGQAEIRQVINVPKVGQIAGCMVTDGSIVRGAKIRVIREGVVVFEGEISSLKRFKDDAREVSKGYECGVGIVGFNDMREGDFIESYKEVQSKASL
ncbi:MULTISPECIES: translation initiation factor IF-2 [unclassified Campylobacter]|uniref:translation initiation factor IF-2 n=1 Tax=unclassified Campylobacter TaxID=2593542 RepID=UPI001E049F67|nr:translation initiation factor IF-2 [Campylobacter sp. RM12654]MBZ7990760.1 translation initiation factor IF-2 [Campylobacter sp. RM9331]MBZ8005590.1 translation initiation factor IF-2 [Campylobacter sp. RM9332]MBZ8006555.1 translation initiation factor IF-2 [Campylobacter sp. RM9334]